MKADIFKKLIKEAVREAIQEEMKDLLLEAVRSNKQPIRESFEIGENSTLRTGENRTFSFTTDSLPPRSPIDTKKAYMDILGEMAKGPKSGLEGEFKLQGNIDPVNGALPEGQLSLDQIMNLTRK